MSNMVPFNRPHLTGKETKYITQAVVEHSKISGNGFFTKQCQRFFEDRFGFRKCLLCTSCTDALEMAAILIGIEKGDEVIVPSYTFSSTANAFILRGARVVFCDSQSGHPNLDAQKVAELITARTRAIVVVHYAGVACDMDALGQLAEEHGLYIVEDAAQAITAEHNGRPLGGIGHIGTFSFHETKNVQCGEGGMLVVNDKQFEERAEIIWEKGTNRAAFWRGDVDKYEWVDIGSSFLPSELNAAYLWAQLEQLDDIQRRRVAIWERYYQQLEPFRDRVDLPQAPPPHGNNAHMFYIVCRDADRRNDLIRHLKECDVSAVFHYQSLHRSRYFRDRHDGRQLPNADYFSNGLLRLPLFYDLRESDHDRVIAALHAYFD